MSEQEVQELTEILDGADVNELLFDRSEIELFLKNEFNPVQNNIVSMFGLQALTLADDDAMRASLESDFEDVMNSGSWVDPENHTFTFDFNEDEVVAWFNENAAKYEEI